MSPNQSKNPYERLLIITNEHSSHARAIQRQIQRVDLPAEYIVTSLDTERTQEELYDKVREDDVIVAAGGDGTAHQVGNMLLSEEGRERGVNRYPFVPVRGGNANDIATMINGRASVRTIVNRGQAIELNPLQVQVEQGDNQDTRYALGYFSVGGTAAASQKLDELKHTANMATRLSGVQFAREAVTSWLTVADTSREIYAAQQNAEQLPVTDYLFMRGDRIAKIGRPHANLTLPKFEAVAMQSHGKFDALRRMFDMKNGKLWGEMLSEVTLIFTASNAQDIPAQYDGETRQLAAGSQLTVSVSPYSYTTLTTRLNSK